MAAEGRPNRSVIPLGSGGGIFPSQDRPFAVIDAVRRTNNGIEIDLSFRNAAGAVNVTNADDSALDGSVFKVTGTTTNIVPNVAVRTP